MKTPKKPNRRNNLLDHIVKPAQDEESLPLEQLPALPLPAPRIEFVPFNTRLTVENDLALDRAKFWLRKSKQELTNDAMREYLKQFPESEKPTPKEMNQ